MMAEKYPQLHASRKFKAATGMGTQKNKEAPKVFDAPPPISRLDARGQIAQLPGYDVPKTKQYSQYFEIRSGVHMHFWFVFVYSGEVKHWLNCLGWLSLKAFQQMIHLFYG